MNLPSQSWRTSLDRREWKSLFWHVVRDRGDEAGLREILAAVEAGLGTRNWGDTVEPRIDRIRESDALDEASLWRIRLREEIHRRLSNFAPFDAGTTERQPTIALAINTAELHLRVPGKNSRLQFAKTRGMGDGYLERCLFFSSKRRGWVVVSERARRLIEQRRAALPDGEKAVWASRYPWRGELAKPIGLLRQFDVEPFSSFWHARAMLEGAHVCRAAAGSGGGAGTIERAIHAALQVGRSYQALVTEREKALAKQARKSREGGNSGRATRAMSATDKRNLAITEVQRLIDSGMFPASAFAHAARNGIGSRSRTTIRDWWYKFGPKDAATDSASD